MTDAFTFGLRSWINEIIAENAILFPEAGCICYLDEGKVRFMPMDHTLEARLQRVVENASCK